VEVPTRNFLAPLRTEVEFECREEQKIKEQQELTTQAGRVPPIILASATNSIELQKHLKGIVKGSFEFRSTKNRTRVVTE
jgi:hypothetical protein